MTDPTSTPSRKPKQPKRAKADSVTPTPRALRLQRQAEYQRAYRSEQKRKRIPSRDDAARVAFHWFVTLMSDNGDEVGLANIHREIVRRLVELGFDESGADRRVSDLFERYEDGWTFQAKPHLRSVPKPDPLS